jgi:hypothetical protein
LDGSWRQLGGLIPSTANSTKCSDGLTLIGSAATWAGIRQAFDMSSNKSRYRQLTRGFAQLASSVAPARARMARMSAAISRRLAIASAV